MLELRYREDVERAHGLPIGQRQEPVMVDGHRRLEDVAYDMPAGRAIVRLDGYFSHADKLTALTDRRRSVAAAMASSIAVPFGWTEVTTMPCRTAGRSGPFSGRSAGPAPSSAAPTVRENFPPL